MSKKSGIVYLLVLALIIVGAAVLFHFYQSSTQSDIQTATKDQLNAGTINEQLIGSALNSKQLAKQLDGPLSEHDLTSAIKRYESIVNSPTSTPVIIASTVLAGSNLKYRMTGSVVDAKQAIRDLKRIANSTDVRAYIRAQALSHIAHWYQSTANSQEVFDEIFNDSAYKQFLVTSDGKVQPLESIIRLYEHAYQISPTYLQAATIADMYVNLLYLSEQKNTDQDKVQSRIGRVEEYLARSEDLARTKAAVQAIDPNIRVGYRAARAFAIGGLAHFKGVPYVTEYKQEFEKAISYIEGQRPGEGKGRAASVHFMYALFLLSIDKDTKSAGVELEKAITRPDDSEDLEGNSLVRQVRAMKQGGGLQFIAPLNVLEDISPKFKAFVDGIK